MESFDSDGVAIAYVDEAPTGEDRGEPILLVHGFASNHAVNWVNTLWVRTLAAAGRRTIALDNRGHGASAKLYDPAAYATELMAEDARRLLDHLGIERADVMGYSMGARITAFLALAHPERVRSALIGGLGSKLVEGGGLPRGVAEAMEAPSADAVAEPSARMFRVFAEQTRSDLRALAACMRGSRQAMSRAEAECLTMPVLVATGLDDAIAGSGERLAAMLPNATVLDLPGKDHNTAVGDRAHRAGVLAFLDGRP